MGINAVQKRVNKAGPKLLPSGSLALEAGPLLGTWEPRFQEHSHHPDKRDLLCLNYANYMVYAKHLLAFWAPRILVCYKGCAYITSSSKNPWTLSRQ